MQYDGREFQSVCEHPWSAEHIARHGVTLEDVREVVLERPYWTTPGRKNSTLVYGQTNAGRYLLVVAAGEDGEAFIVTARDMNDAERRTFRKKAR
jgi:uncharacterized DUF497 family protein